MARQPTTWLQVSGYRFLVRRLEHALLRADIRMLHDPMRAQSRAFIAGCVLAVIAVAGCAILAFLRPHGALGSAPIVMARESGALYVHVGDTVHPVLNLASARLAAGTASNPDIVSESEINKAKRGPLLGISGAPAVIGEPLTNDESAWTVCDSSTTTVIAGGEHDIERLSSQPSILVTPRSESAATTYLLYEGRRAEVDLRNPIVVRALRLDGITPRPVSRALLDAIPEAPPIASPYISAAGSPGPVTGLRVGTVVRMTRADAVELYVVLAEGVQRVGEVTADLIRLSDSQGVREVPSVSPDVIGALPTVNSLPVSTFPERTARPLGIVGQPILCAHWLPGRADTAVLPWDSLPFRVEDKTMTLAQADGEGSRVDSAVVPPGRSAYVRSVGLAGDAGNAGPLFVVTDGGVLFGVHDEDAGKLLGLTAPPVQAPWPVLALLPRGPELSKQSALVERDSVLPPS
jgi:type VII secretion protein EccB